MNMYQFLEKVVSENPKSILLLREGLTYQDFLNRVKETAVILRDNFDVKFGDVVGLLAHNIPEFMYSYFAILSLGARTFMMDTNLTHNEYENAVKKLNAKLVLAEDSFIFDTDIINFVDIQTLDKKIDLKSFEPANVQSTDIASLYLTSGSTGTPKIVPLTHFNLIETMNSLDELKSIGKPGSVFYCFLPAYHVFGFVCTVMMPLYLRGSIVLQPSINPKLILSDFQEFKPDIIPSVPRMWEMFYNKIRDNARAQKKWTFMKIVLYSQNFLKYIGLGWLVNKVKKPIHELFGGNVKIMIAGGAAMKPDIEKFFQRLGFLFVQGYGLTETVGPICLSIPWNNPKSCSVGRPLKNNYAEIRNKNKDGIGELWLKGHNVFCGYQENEELNKEVFDNSWFNSGDLAKIDKYGRIFIKGRKKSIIVLDSGKNVYPDELEDLYLQIEGVKNVAVFEYVVKKKTVSYAVFQVRPNVTLDYLNREIMKQNILIAPYKWVKHFAITTDELPQTSTKKLKHHEVKKLLESGYYTDRKD